MNKTDILYIISFRQGELIIPFLRKVLIILGNSGLVAAGHRGEIFTRKNINAGKFFKIFATISTIIIMGDKLANKLAQKFPRKLKILRFIDISAKMVSRLKKLRHQINRKLDKTRVNSFLNFTRLQLTTQTSTLFQLACITGVIFSLFEASKGKREASEERQTRATGKGVSGAPCTLRAWGLPWLA